MWVVKLGGSIAKSKRLLKWLSALAEYGAGRVVVVPGGGAFANQVRGAQKKWGFSEAHAHEMALLAVHQYGMMLCGLNSSIMVPAANEHEMDEGLRAGKIPVWLPYSMVVREAELPRNWDLTSDSLAAWLAGRLAAKHLILVKSAIPHAKSVSVSDMCQLGIVDPAFCKFTEAANYSIWWLHSSQHDLLCKVFGRESLPPTVVISNPLDHSRGFDFGVIS